MEKIKWGWWLYNGVQVVIWVIVSGVLVGIAKLIEKEWGLDLEGWGSQIVTTIVIATVVSIIREKVERVAKAACRAAKLPPDGRDALWDAWWLQESAPNELPVPEPPPINFPMPLTLGDRATLWGCRILGMLGAVFAIASVFDRDWENFGSGIVGAVMFLGGAALVSRQIDVLQVNENGLYYGKTGSLVSWDSVECGWISVYRGFNGKGTNEWLCFQNVYDRIIFEAPIHRLPPAVRADLFAWLRARANLREPNLHDEIFEWLESISDFFVQR